MGGGRISKCTEITVFYEYVVLHTIFEKKKTRAKTFFTKISLQLAKVSRRDTVVSLNSNTSSLTIIVGVDATTTKSNGRSTYLSVSFFLCNGFQNQHKWRLTRAQLLTKNKNKNLNNTYLTNICVKRVILRVITSYLLISSLRNRTVYLLQWLAWFISMSNPPKSSVCKCNDEYE